MILDYYKINSSGIYDFKPFQKKKNQYFEIDVEDNLHLDFSSIYQIADKIKQIDGKIALDTHSYELVTTIRPDIVILHNFFNLLNGQVDDIIEFCRDTNTFVFWKISKFDDDDLKVISYNLSLYPWTFFEIDTSSYDFEYILKYLKQYSGVDHIYWKDLPLCYASKFNVKTSFEQPYVRQENKEYCIYSTDSTKFSKKGFCKQCLNYNNCLGLSKQFSSKTILYETKTLLRYHNIIKENVK